MFLYHDFIFAWYMSCSPVCILFIIVLFFSFEYDGVTIQSANQRSPYSLMIRGISL